ncbi:MAG TPA: PAS domain S-box protein, partial [Pelobium sp.]|nr:PAS domain S-box protein [Pelobium sp.]
MNGLNFLSSKGEMGTLIREKDWSNHPLGNPIEWPQSLKTTLSIILNSKFPKFLFWGENLRCFYNDAYRPSLGVDGKHPTILGQEGEKAWPEIWGIIKPMMDSVFETGEATWSKNQLIPFYRNGKIEDIYWTFSYSPIVDEEGKIAGIFTSCVETTIEVNSRKELEKVNQRYHDNIMHAPAAMCVLRGKSHVVEIANDLMLELWGKTTEDVLNKPVFEGLPEIKGQGLEAIMDEAYYSGKKFEANERPVILPRNGELKQFYLNFVYEPIRDADGKVDSIVAIATDVTFSVLARQKIQESEERLNLVIEATELAVWELDLRTQQTIHTERYAQIFGFNSVNDAKREDIVKQIHPEDRIARDTAHKNVLKTGFLKYESRIIWNDGNMRWIDVNGKLFYDQDNQPLKIIGTVRDITKEKNFEQDLIDREEKFRLLADEMPQFVWTSNAEGRLNYFNKSVYKYADLDEYILESNEWFTIVHPEDREENVRIWKNSITTGKDFLFEHRFRRKDGEYRWQLSRAKALRDANGSITMWVGTSTDIQEIKELDEQKDYFISMASHELKTPITSIKGYIQLLESKYRNAEDPFLKNSLKIVRKQIENLTTLVVDLLDVSKIRTGSLQLRKSQFNINNLITEVISEIQHINPHNEINFNADKKIDINADEESIRQVIINFLTNAVKYSPNAKQVTVSLKANEDELTVCVTDAGIGISAENQKKIFDRFYRVEGKNEKTFPGFGIGLFIAAEI